MLQKLQVILKYMNEKQKIITVNSYMLTNLQYSMPPIIGDDTTINSQYCKSKATKASGDIQIYE